MDDFLKILKVFCRITFSAFCSIIVSLVYYFTYWSLFEDTQPRLIQMSMITRVIIFMFISGLFLANTVSFYRKEK